ncbi:MAG: hypothetical protein EP324_04145 [Gammaproteobacteria bacterium]|nr:MAG: hypothetical protein EP324_04145 [Gammaproteobacteria bacterium]
MCISHISFSKRTGYQGAVLLVALIFLLLLSIVAVTTMRINTLELLMSGNEQSRVEAFQKAQAIVESLDSDEAHFNVLGESGYMVCSGVHTETGGDCKTNDLLISNASTTDVLADADYYEYDVTELYTGPVPRLSPKWATGSGDATIWDIRGYYDDRANKRGESEIVLGSMKVYPGSETHGQKSLGGESGPWVDKNLQKPATN